MASVVNTVRFAEIAAQRAEVMQDAVVEERVVQGIVIAISREPSDLAEGIDVQSDAQAAGE
jgi:hypothetical protein